MGINYFDKLVFEAVSQIPEGRVTTYGEIARALGDIRAARAVGESLKKNPWPVDVPCHRVVLSDGSLGGYAYGGPAKKKELLQKEGITFRNGKVDLERHLITHKWFKVNPVFEKMRKAQDEIRKRAVTDCAGEPTVAVGVDVSYWGDVGVGAAVAVTRKGEVLDKRTWVGRVELPYVPTYLAFREMPFIWNAVKEMDFDVLLADGHGRLHPRGAGEATHFGVVLNVPSIGVAKRKLVGTENGERVLLNGEHVGWKVGKAYVSPGNKVDVDTALKIATAFWSSGKQPVPLVLAHKLAVDKMRAVRKEMQGFSP